jgi:hypothetical protein
MSRSERSLLAVAEAAEAVDAAAGEAAPADSAKIAEDIGMAALELAERARTAGLTTIGYLLESVALEAGAQAAAGHWRADGEDR